MPRLYWYFFGAVGAGAGYWYYDRVYAPSLESTKHTQQLVEATKFTSQAIYQRVEQLTRQRPSRSADRLRLYYETELLLSDVSDAPPDVVDKGHVTTMVRDVLWSRCVPLKYRFGAALSRLDAFRAWVFMTIARWMVDLLVAYRPIRVGQSILTASLAALQVHWELVDLGKSERPELRGSNEPDRWRMHAENTTSEGAAAVPAAHYVVVPSTTHDVTVATAALAERLRVPGATVTILPYSPDAATRLNRFDRRGDLRATLPPAFLCDARTTESLTPPQNDEGAPVVPVICANMQNVVSEDGKTLLGLGRQVYRESRLSETVTVAVCPPCEREQLWPSVLRCALAALPPNENISASL